MSKDFMITVKDVQNICNVMDGADWKYDTDQAQSIRCFAQHQKEHVLHYQEMGESQPFEIVISTPRLLELLVKHGHARPLFIDSTFGTNNLKLCLSHQAYLTHPWKWFSSQLVVWS
jgi:hypothetical protein